MFISPEHVSSDKKLLMSVEIEQIFMEENSRFD